MQIVVWTRDAAEPQYVVTNFPQKTQTMDTNRRQVRTDTSE